MSPRDDSSHLEAELRRVMARRPAPPQLGLRVMANIRAEAQRRAEDPRQAARPGKLWFRSGWALAAVACAALLVIVFALPRERDEIQSQAMEMAGGERELAEVLHLVGSQWNRAQASAFPLGQDNEHD